MPSIRDAVEGDLTVLSDLALRSKAHWGYDGAFLDACRAELTITPARLARERVRVAEDGRGVLGFASVAVAGPAAELMDLFVEPAYIGEGVGVALFDDAVALAVAAGARSMRIEADPNAEDWYVARGATPVGRAPSGSIPGRLLPVLQLDLGQAPPLRRSHR